MSPQHPYEGPGPVHIPRSAKDMMRKIKLRGAMMVGRFMAMRSDLDWIVLLEPWDYATFRAEFGDSKVTAGGVYVDVRPDATVTVVPGEVWFVGCWRPVGVTP